MRQGLKAEIVSMLMEGVQGSEIARRLNCTRAYVSLVRCEVGLPKLKCRGVRNLNIQQSCSQKITPTDMVVTPWFRDSLGNLTREIRGV